MIVACLVLLALATLPTAMTFVNLAVLKRPAAASLADPIAILIPARDEEERIAECVASALAAQGVAEVIVLDDQSRDATAAIVSALAARDPRLRLATAPPLPPGWSGKQHACHVLSGLSAAPILIFVDADVRLAPDAPTRLAAALATADLVSGVPRQVMGTFPERLMIPMINVLLLGYLPIPLMRRDGRPSLGAACGQLVAVRAESYRRAGGHGAVPDILHDGLALPRLFRRAGLRTDLVQGADLASCRMYDGWRSVVGGLLKNATEGMAKPLALPVWTVLLIGGHVLPWVALAAAIVTANGSATVLAGLACAGPLAARSVQAYRCREPAGAVLLHPLGVTVLTGLQWLALLRRSAARPAHWRGRSYPVRQG